jgi:hypothetical protein
MAEALDDVGHGWFPGRLVFEGSLYRAGGVGAKVKDLERLVAPDTPDGRAHGGGKSLTSTELERRFAGRAPGAGPEGT